MSRTSGTAISDYPAITLFLLPLALASTWPFFGHSWWAVVLAVVVFLPMSPIALVATASWFNLAYLLLPTLLAWAPEAPLTVGIVLAGQTILVVTLALLGKLTGTNQRSWIHRLLARVDWGHVRAVLALAFIGLFLWALMRTTPLFHAAAWAVMLGCTWASLPPAPRPMRAYAPEWAILAVSLAASLAILDTGARFLLEERQQYDDVFEPHPKYVFTLKPNASGVLRVTTNDGTKHKWPLEISSQGFRDRFIGEKEPEEYRVLMLGDSFTMGHVPFDDTIPKQLESILRDRVGDRPVTVVNAGIGGSGPIQQLGMLRERGLPLKPDLVILQVFMGNDIANTLEAEAKALDTFNREELQLARRRRMMANNARPFRVEAYMRSHSRLYREIVWMNHNHDLIGEWLAAWRIFPKVELSIPLRQVNRYPLSEANLKTWYPKLEEGFRLWQDQVRKMKAECDAAGIPFAAYCIPQRFEANDERWRQFVDAQPQAAYEQHKACRVALEFFDEFTIPHFELHDALKNAGPLEKTYYDPDGHLTSFGNGVAADVTAKFILENFFADSNAYSDSNSNNLSDTP